jgi:hypothetical protein
MSEHSNAIFMFFFRRFFGAACCFVLIFASCSSSAQATCTLPNAPEGAREWFAGEQIYKLCNDIAWVPYRIGATIDGDLTDGLIAHWAMDETSGIVVSDVSGHGNDGTLIDMDVPAAWSLGYHDNALMFDGVDDYITVPHHASQNLELGYTFVAWMYFDSTAIVSVHGANISKGNIGGWGSRWLIGRTHAGGAIVDGKIRLNVGHNFNLNFSGWDYPVDEWVHVAVTWNGNNISYYANGVLVFSAAWNTPPNANTGDLIMGTGRSNWGHEFFKGALDDVRLYNRALSLFEIQAIMTLSCARASTMDFDVALGRYKFCDGHDWKVIECIAGNPGPCPSLGVCNTPRAIDYFPADKALGWCDGANWQVMAQ